MFTRDQVHCPTRGRDQRVSQVRTQGGTEVTGSGPTDNGNELRSTTPAPSQAQCPRGHPWNVCKEMISRTWLSLLTANHTCVA